MAGADLVSENNIAGWLADKTNEHSELYCFCDHPQSSKYYHCKHVMYSAYQTTNLPTSNSGNPGWCHLSSFLFDVSLCLSLFLLLHFIIISHMLLPPFQIICRPTFFTPCLTTHIIQKFMQNITSFVVGCCWHPKLANIEVR